MVRTQFLISFSTDSVFQRFQRWFSCGDGEELMLGLTPCFSAFGYMSLVSCRLSSLCMPKHSVCLNLLFTHKRSYLCKTEGILFIHNKKLHYRKIIKLKGFNFLSPSKVHSIIKSQYFKWRHA